MQRTYHNDHQVKFPTDRGWHTKPGKRGVAVLLHGSHSSPANNEALAKSLLAKEYGIISPLLAGHGLGADSPQASAHQLWEQVGALITEVKKQNSFCMVVGSSMGGTLALLSGTLAIPPDLIVSVSGALACRPDHGHPWTRTLNELKERLYRVLPDIITPSLILHDIDDNAVSSKDAFAFIKRLGSRRKKCIYFSGTGHSLMFSNYCKELVEDIENFRSFILPYKKVHIEYQGSAHTVYLAGEFNNWQAHSLAFNNLGNSKFSIEIELICGSYPYKLIVDGHWILDPRAKTIAAPNGELNSLLEVK